MLPNNFIIQFWIHYQGFVEYLVNLLSCKYTCKYLLYVTLIFLTKCCILCGGIIYVHNEEYFAWNSFDFSSWKLHLMWWYILCPEREKIRIYENNVFSFSFLNILFSLSYALNCSPFLILELNKMNKVKMKMVKTILKKFEILSEWDEQIGMKLVKILFKEYWFIYAYVHSRLFFILGRIFMN